MTLGPLAADLVGLPEDRDLLGEGVLELLALVGRQVRVVVPVSRPAIRTCARSIVRRVASVGCAVRTSSSETLLEPPPHGVGRHRGEQLERLDERLARRLHLLGIGAAPPDPVVLLGGVRELEVGARTRAASAPARAERAA